MPGEPMKWPTKVCAGRSNSSSGVPICTTAPVVHDHDLVGEGQRLRLVVRHVDHREVELAVQRLEGRAQLPFQVRIDHRQRLVEQDGGDVRAHQAAAERDLLLGVGREVARLRSRTRVRSSSPAISSTRAVIVSRGTRGS